MEIDRRSREYVLGVITGGHDNLTLDEFDSQPGHRTADELADEVARYEAFVWREEHTGQRRRTSLSAQIAIESADGYELRLVGKTYPGHREMTRFKSGPKPYALSETRRQPRDGTSEGMRPFDVASLPVERRAGRETGRGETGIETALWAFLEELGITRKQIEVARSKPNGLPRFGEFPYKEKGRPHNFKGVLTPDIRRGFPGPEQVDEHDSSVYYRFRSTVLFQGFRLWTPARVHEQWKNGRALRDSSGVLDHTEWFPLHHN